METLPSEIGETAHALRKAFGRRAASLGVTGAQWKVLFKRLPDPADRRAWRLQVTAKAKPVVAKLRAIADEMTAEAFEGIASKDIETTRRVLAQVRERACQFATVKPLN